MAKHYSIEQILKELNEARYADDRKVPTLHGVSGLSKSDVDMAMLYVEQYGATGSAPGHLMEPRGKVKELLDRYGIRFEKDRIF